MKKLGLFVGIDVYAEFSPLRGAANDANNMAGLFHHRLGFDTRVLTHEHLGRGESIERTIRAMVADLVESDMFVFFFAGHGKSPQPLPGARRDQLLILPDVVRKALEDGRTEGTLGLLWVERVTEKKGLQRAFIIDACRAPLDIEDQDSRDGDTNFSFDGEAVYRDLGKRRQRPGTIDSPLVVFNSCRDKQRAIELRSKGQGLFTSSVIQVVKACVDNDKPVRIDDSFEDAVAEQMLSSAQAHGIHNAEQRPLRVGVALCLFDANDRQNRAQRELLEAFAGQLACGALDDPIGNCARDSLVRLDALNLVAEQLQPLRERYRQALAQRQVARDQDFDAGLINLAIKMNRTVYWLNYLSNSRLHEHDAQAHRAIQDLESADQARDVQKNQDEEKSRLAAQKLAESIARHDKDFQALGEAPSAEDCDLFLQRYPDSVQAQRVKTLREYAIDDLAFFLAQKQGKEKYYSDYLSEFPLGRHANVAHQHLEALKVARKRARQAQDPRSAEGSDEPQKGKMVEGATELESLRLRDEADWTKAFQCGTAWAFTQYLENWPKGARVNDANDAKKWAELIEDDRWDTRHAGGEGFKMLLGEQFGQVSVGGAIGFDVGSFNCRGVVLTDTEFEAFETQVMHRQKPLKEASNSLGWLMGMFEKTSCEAVIAIPGSSSIGQAAQARVACSDAGIQSGDSRPLRTVSAPVLAALALAAEQQLFDCTRAQERLIAVCDFGHTTFSVAIVEIYSVDDELQVEVLATAGCSHLGGHNFDLRLTEYLCEKYYSQFQIRLQQYPGVMLKIRDVARQAREILSTHMTTSIQYPGFNDKGLLGFEILMTRQDLENICDDLISKTVEICVNALTYAKVEINSLYLIGGMANVPQFKQRIGNKFKCEPVFHPYQDYLAAIGAAIQSSIIHGSKQDLLLLDCTRKSLAIELQNGEMNIFIPKNVSFMRKFQQPFLAPPDATSIVTLRVCECIDSMDKQYECIAQFDIPGLLQNQLNRIVDISYDLDLSGAVNIEACVLASNFRSKYKVDGSESCHPTKYPLLKEAYRERDIAFWRYCSSLENGEMIRIEAGSFEMGAAEGEANAEADEKPRRRVTLRAFEIGRTVVTQGEWEAVMGDYPSHFKEVGNGWPVENISWNDAQEFLKKLNEKTGKTYRLPTEAEWEYAARAGSNTAFWWGDHIDPTLANYDGNDTYNGGTAGEYRESTVHVCMFEANPWGLYNVHGNVWEWVQDAYHTSYKGAPQDGKAWEDGDFEKDSNGDALRVLRGGCWSDIPELLRSANRYWFTPDHRSGGVGLRIARTL